MYILKKEFRFEASHVLPNHDGKCARLHGHSWVGRIEVRRKDLIITGPQKGMVLDYKTLSLVIDPIVETYLDHRHLNDSTGLKHPTSENLARWIYDEIEKLDTSHVVSGLVTAIEIEETCTSFCRYEPEGLRT